MKCDIIIPIWNNLEYTRDCLNGIVNNTTYPYRLILIDNASDAPTRDYLDSFEKQMGQRGAPEVVLIRNSQNLGYVKAVNQGLRISDATYVCVYNNDTVPAPGWLERMVDFAEAHEDVGLINPLCDGHGDTPIEAYAQSLTKNKGTYMEMNQCQGFCMLIKRELIDKIGYLDEAFGIGGYDDTDYSMRAHTAGYRCVAIYDSYVYHRQHASFNKAGNREEWVQRNRKIYYDKWGKHLRVGVALALDDGDEEKIKRVVSFVYGLAREWSWVHLWVTCKTGANDMKKMIEACAGKNGFPLHQNIRIDCFNLPKVLLGLTICGKMLERLRKRMRDKKFDAIVVFDGAAKGPLAVCSKMVGSSIIALSLSDDCDDWQKKGKETALFIKQKRREYE